MHPIWFYILKNMKKLLFSALLAAGLFAAGCSPKGQVQNAQVPGVGEVIRDTLNGVPCCVYLPEHYVDRTEVYPVLYLQHGMWGNEFDWTLKGNLLGIMDSLLRAGAVRAWSRCRDCLRPWRAADRWFWRWHLAAKQQRTNFCRRG